MNKTQAIFCTTDESIVAYLLWNRIVPVRVELTPPPIFLYYKKDNYRHVMQKYWQGDYIPACEMGQCYSIVRWILQGKEFVDLDMVNYELDQLQDYREMYAKEITIGDVSQLDFGIMNRLEQVEPTKFTENIHV